MFAVVKDAGIRLQKYLAERGIASRRKAADCISAGRVTVNGLIITEPGKRVFPERDRIAIDGTTVALDHPPARTIALYKPRGYVCSRAGQGSRTVYELLPKDGATMLPAGRLDKDSEGLLIMSNDGALIQDLTHPRFRHRRVYRVTVSGEMNARALKSLSSPIAIDGRSTLPCRVRVVRAGDKPGRTVLEFELTEGRNRQVRRLCARAGLKVHRLVRTALGNIKLAGLKPGQWREVAAGDLERLS